MNGAPKVSVIIPVYNAENYLRQCLDSIVNQTLQDIEIICVNDGSTDRSLEILQQISQQDSRVRVFTWSHQGVGATKDHGMYQAIGEYIAFCDSDDVMPQGALSCLYEVALQNHEVDIVVGNYKEVYENEKEKVVNVQSDSDFWLIFNSIILCNKLFRRNFIVSNNLHIPKMSQSEDRVFMTDVFLYGPQIFGVNEISYCWIRREHSKVKSLSFRFSEQDYFDRIYSWYYSIDKLLNAGYKEANLLLFKASGYLKSLYDSYPYLINKDKAFDQIQKLMCRADWSINLSRFNEIWKMPYPEFSTLNYDRYENKEIKSSSIVQNNEIQSSSHAPKVTVIIPCYNAEKYLKECIDSVLNQTLKEIQIICVDDGSTDCTLKILKDYTNIDRRIMVLHQENKFAGAARNLGMEHAKGEYLIFLDSDDFFDRNMLELAYNKALQEQADILVFNAYYYQEGTGKLIDAPWLLNTSYLPSFSPFSRKDIPKHIFSFLSTAPWNKLFNRNFILKINIQFQTTQRMNDAYFVMSAIALAERITTLDKKLLFYRVGHSSSLQATATQTPTDIFKALIKIQETLITRGIYQEVKQSFINLCIRNLIYVLDTLKNGKVFEDFYNQMKNQAFNELNIINLKKEDFFNEYYYRRYTEILENTPSEYLFKVLLQTKKSLLEKEDKIATFLKLDDSKQTASPFYHRSYKIGCAITWIPRKLRGGIRCFKEHGFLYTFRRILEHLSLPMKLIELKTKKKDKLKSLVKNKPKQLIEHRNNIKRPPLQIVVSLTSFPARINIVHEVIQSLFNQTIKADKIILWLAESQFPLKEEELPPLLLCQLQRGLEIRWCDDIGPHKKYYYTMQEYSDSIVITVDDDIRYSKELIETLLGSYYKHPYAVSAIRAHQITFESDGSISPYSKWKREYSNIGQPSLALLATGVGGVLYPPNSMHKELFNKESILKLCLYGDDLWLKAMQLLMLTPVVVAKNIGKLNYIEGSQEIALWKQNDINGENNIQFLNILRKYDGYLSNIDTLTYRMRLSVKGMDEFLEKEKYNEELKRNLQKSMDEILAIHNSYTYRIGRFITFIPRKIRGGIRCYKEHGMRYTLRRMKEKILGLFRRKRK